MYMYMQALSEKQASLNCTGERFDKLIGTKNFLGP